MPYKSDMSLTQGLWHNPDGMILHQANIWANIKQGRNHLITIQWGKLVTDAREVINEGNEPYDTSTIHEVWIDEMMSNTSELD